jgi:hypothetical protein
MRLSVRHLIPVGGALLALSVAAGPGAASPFISGATSLSANSTPPVITRFKVSHARFRVGASRTALTASASSTAPTGTTFTLRVSERATVAIAFVGRADGHRSGNRCVVGDHGGPACAVLVKPGGLIRNDRGPGMISIPFSGRLGNVPLAPGAYVAGVGAIDRASNVSNFAFVRFVVVPG